MSSEVYTQTFIAFNTALIVLLAWVIIVLIVDPYIARRGRNLMLLNSVIILSLLFSQWMGVYFTENALVAARLVTSIYEYAMRPVVIAIFLQVISKDNKQWILVVINALIFMTAFFSDIAFTITADNIFERGPLGYTCHIVGFILLVWLVVRTIIRYRQENSMMTLLPILIAFLIFVAVIVDSFILKNYYISFLMVSMVIGCVMYYTWLHLQFVREHEEDLKAQQRIKIMMSQIQPHFMYNTLSTIQALCLSDPQKASETTGKFGTFLRQNIDSLSQTELIPFEKELEHTETYAEIEMVRFPFLRIEYDTDDMDFACGETVRWMYSATHFL